TVLNIQGGLKTYCETRWTSIYETVASISNFQIALEYYANEIKSNSVKKLIKSSSFFINIDKLVEVLKPVKTLPIQGMQKFRQHSINAFNKYCKKFDPNIYILAYFLHPAFRAEQIWKNKGDYKKTCDHLLAQIRNYELKVDSYDQEFDKQIETPMSCAGYERIFSTLSWLYGKRQQRLGLLKIEVMAKIHSFYISNIKNELAYVGQQHSED
ncbi:13240_t:CDS:2, partial [Funneliformis geosporum]